MGELRGGAEDLGARRGGGPDVVDGDGAGEQTCGRGRVDVVVLCVEGDAGRCPGEVEPGGIGGDGGGKSERYSSVVVERDGLDVLATEVGEERGEGEAELTACTVTGEDDVRGIDRGVEGPRRWSDEVEVCRESVEESAWKWVLRGQAVAEGKDTAPGFTSQLSRELSMTDLDRISRSIASTAAVRR